MKTIIDSKARCTASAEDKAKIDQWFLQDLEAMVVHQMDWCEGDKDTVDRYQQNFNRIVKAFKRSGK